MTNMVMTHRYSFSGRSRWNILVKNSEKHGVKSVGHILVLTLLSNRSMESKLRSDVYATLSTELLDAKRELTLRFFDLICRPF